MTDIFAQLLRERGLDEHFLYPKYEELFAPGNMKGIKKAVAGNRIGDIGHAVQEYAEARSYSVVRKFVGHGVGAKLHEDPSVPNYGMSGKGIRLLPGMTIAIEPMINQGTFKVRILDDGWTTVTADGKLSAHFEHTVAITSDGTVILTSAD